MSEFLSGEWFEQVMKLRNEAGDLEPPAALADLVINITVEADEGEKHLALVAGMLEPGHHEEAETTMIVPKDLAKQVFIENDQAAGMNGFMSGQIRVEGDMSKLMALQTAQPSGPQMELMKKIQEITD